MILIVTIIRTFHILEVILVGANFLYDVCSRKDYLCDLVVTVSGYRSIGADSILGATRISGSGTGST
jgi:hypothetical protein